MIKGNIVIISRTPWSESPRIRHQITRLVRDIGYCVFYIEILYHKIPLSDVNDSGIQIFRIYERIHHQLKPFKFLKALNSNWIKRDLAKLDIFKEVKVVFNFNYDNDYSFSLFNDKPTISVINDDFIAMAKPWMKNQALKSLGNTLKLSSFNLTVSYFLQRQISLFNVPSDIFLPWAENVYSPPISNKKRDVVLYYGYISRLDLSIIDSLVKYGIKLRFVGPIEGNGKKLEKKYKFHKNVEILDPISLENLDTTDVCCSIAIYDVSLSLMTALTVSNRFFQLLAFGIPQVYPYLPNLIKAPIEVLRTCSTVDDYANAINYFRNNFDLIQPKIKYFLQDHTKVKRKEYLDNLINNLK